MTHPKYSEAGAGKSHFDGCHKVHLDCALRKLEEARALMRALIDVCTRADGRDWTAVQDAARWLNEGRT